MKILSVPYRFFHKNPVLCLAMLLAVGSSFFVPPDGAYLGYFDFNTLTCLFCTLGVVCALQDAHFFTILAERLVRLTGNLRMAVLSLIVITFLGSMVLANDMALLTFLPLGYTVLKSTDNLKYLAPVFILQNISANLGGMLTPFGNPQNLYLYSYFNIPTVEFLRIMLPAFLIAITLLVLFCIPVKPIKLSLNETFPEKLNLRKAILYGLLFAFSILIVFRMVPFVAGLAIIPVILFFVDRDSLKMVDYALLGTFFFFFIFAGNLARLDLVNSILSSLLEKDTLIVSILSCQVISNVPSAILLSRFTTEYPALLLGVNIGGTGTLIASLASLITFSEFKILYPHETKKYLLIFTALNITFLAVLTVAVKFIL